MNKNDIELGSKVFLEEDRGEMYKIGGVVLAIEVFECPDHVYVSWNSGHTRSKDIELVDADHLYLCSDEDYEEEFIKVASEVSDKINNLVSDATEKYKKAETLSKDTGIPFESIIGWKSHVFVPSSMRNKFPHINNSMISDYTGVNAYDLDHHDDDDDEAWQRSNLNC